MIRLRREFAVAVVLADEEDRQLVQRGHVRRFVERAFVGRAVAEERNGDVLRLLEFLRERRADRDRRAAADDAVRAEHAEFHVADVHAAAFALAVAGRAAEQLGEHPIELAAFCDQVAVAAVRAGDLVVVRQMHHHAGWRRLPGRHRDAMRPESCRLPSACRLPPRRRGCGPCGGECRAGPCCSVAWPKPSPRLFWFRRAILCGSVVSRATVAPPQVARYSCVKAARFSRDEYGMREARCAASPVQPIRPAASVILARDTDPGFEILMLRRTAHAAFAGGMYVFPGGRVDGDDHLHVYDALRRGPDDGASAATARARRGVARLLDRRHPRELRRGRRAARVRSRRRVARAARRGHPHALRRLSPRAASRRTRRSTRSACAKVWCWRSTGCTS